MTGNKDSEVWSGIVSGFESACVQCGDNSLDQIKSLIETARVLSNENNPEQKKWCIESTRVQSNKNSSKTKTVFKTTTIFFQKQESA